MKKFAEGIKPFLLQFLPYQKYHVEKKFSQKRHPLEGATLTGKVLAAYHGGWVVFKGY
ncbi:MAG: hypothetical protein J6C11_08975 [Spirochaetaceae bacterium]|nr:hypothetical protein [Spirochaetaceae bacterium]